MANQQVIKFTLSPDAQKQIAAFLKVVHHTLYKHVKTLPEDAYKGQLLISNFLTPDVFSARELAGATTLPKIMEPESEEVAEEAPEETPAAPKMPRKKRGRPAGAKPGPKVIAKTKKKGPKPAIDLDKSETKDAKPEGLLTANEACEYLGINRNLLGYHKLRGNVKAIKEGSLLYFDPKELDRFKAQYVTKSA